MKMTPPLGRIMCVCVCVAVLYWFPQFSVECAKSHQGDSTHLSSQDVSSGNKEVETSDHQKVAEENNEENWLPPAPLSSESVQLIEAGHQREARIAEGSVEKQSAKAPDVERVAEENLNANKRNSQLKETPVNHHPAALSSKDEDSILVDATPTSQDLSTLNREDDMKNSVSFSDSAAAYESVSSEVPASDLPPSECEEENPYDNDSSPPLVLENTSNAHTTGTKSHTEPPLSPPAGHSTQPREANASHMLVAEQEMRPPLTTETDLTMSSKDPEDIPTFDEWKRKMMEVEKEKTVSTHNSNNGLVNAVKKAQKNFNNYASVECGAKILGANPEAKSTSAILKENMDLYMLNPCGNKIWFIIELCEPIQLKQLDIANFELFSSTPKDFLVSISDRYPTNKWLKLGTFHGRDERTVQSFPLDEHLYAKYMKRFTKYIKVELVSHFGSEHFCPLSLIRVFGTSMVEEYEEIAEPPERPEDPDDDLDSPSGLAPGDAKLSKNLIGSAKDAILNMVNNIAVNVLGGNSEMPGNLSHQEVNKSETSTNLQTTVETATIEPSPIPEKEEEGLPSDAVNTIVGPTEEMPAAPNSSTEELAPKEEIIVFPLEKDEEEPISSSIILLDKEEDLEEDTDKMNQQEKQIHPPDITSLHFSCSLATSLYEYLQQKCSASLDENRRCQTVKKTQIIKPTRTVPWYLPLTPSDCSSVQNNHNALHEKKEALQPEGVSDTATPKTQKPPSITAESMSEALLVEPSLITNVLETSATDPPLGKPTHHLETPSLPLDELVNNPEVIKNQKTKYEEERTDSSALPPSIFQSTPSSTLLKDKEMTIDESHVKTSTVGQTQVTTDQSPGLLPTMSAQPEPQSELTGVSKGDAAFVDANQLSPELEPSSLHSTIVDAKPEDLSDILASPLESNGILSHLTSVSLSDIYAEAPNGTEQNGNLVHSSNQKESVFMRLNNRIKALEMNMSLSGRYLEQLSQRYRKQMEEMQKAFNKTIIKLQNTSQIAEEQDQRQTESIQLLQGQLENVTQLVLNLSVRVSQLQRDVLDRQNYLLLSLMLCLGFGLLLCAYNWWTSPIPPTTEPEPPTPKSYTSCHPEREFSSDETGLKRSASFPLIHSDSLQLASTDGLERLHSEETLSLCLTNKKKKRRKMKSLGNMETLKPSLDIAGELCNGALLCNGAPVTTNPTPYITRLLHPSFRDSPSEGSSEASSHSDDPSFCGITTACSRFCDGLPVVKTRAGKRALRRRRPKTSCAVVDLLHAS